MPDSIISQAAPPITASKRQRRTLLVVAPWPYHTQCGIGGGVLCYHLLERLSERFDIHFLSFDQVPNDPEGGRLALSRICESVTLIPTPAPERGLGDKWGQFSQIVTRRPREVRGLHSADMARAVSTLAQVHKPTAVLLQFPQMAQYAGDCGDAPVVVDVQDAALVSRFREWRTAEGQARRLARLVAWVAWLRYELHWYACADGLIAISESDHGALRSFLPDTPCLLSPVAADVLPHQVTGERSYAAFIGNFNHAPNRDGLEWLLRSIWPAVRNELPELDLHVAGPGIPAWAGNYAADGVVNRGFVEDLDDFYGKARVALVPYRFGGGTKIKALDAMARACPIVATPIGAEGLGVTPGLEMEVAEDAQSFAAAVVRICRSEVLGNRLAKAAQTHLSRHFSWDTKVNALARMLEDVEKSKRWVGDPASPNS